jgi:hypothetical protein
VYRRSFACCSHMGSSSSSKRSLFLRTPKHKTATRFCWKCSNLFVG